MDQGAARQSEGIHRGDSGAAGSARLHRRLPRGQVCLPRRKHALCGVQGSGHVRAAVLRCP
nr:MAG TPA_asm: hypothetical protein [Caudoviricetes sp.]